LSPIHFLFARLERADTQNWLRGGRNTFLMPDKTLWQIAKPLKVTHLATGG
jgi:hypothetical protein